MPPKKLIFVVTEDWYFYSHRKPMIRAAQECGFNVSVITKVDQHREAIEALGLKVIPFSFERRSLNPFKALGQVFQLSKIYKQEQPIVVHHIAMKPILFGALAAWLARVPHVVNAFAGLGFVFNARTALAKALRVLLWLPFRLLLRRKNSWLLFQNRDDKALMKAQGFVEEVRTRIIRGSGIDLDEYPVVPMSDPAGGVRCVFAGRMIGIKGLPTLKDAFVLLKERGCKAVLDLYGKPDLENPGSWSEQDLQGWDTANENVNYKGHADNMADVWAGAHIAIQASYGGEGVPKSLLEAASCGRAVVATDVPGCREVVNEGLNGFLVPPYDAKALADAIEKLANDPDLCRGMGAQSRKMVETDMSAENVQTQTAQLYSEIVGDSQDDLKLAANPVK